MNRQLCGAITVVGGSNTYIGAGIVKAFLLQDALVIAPLSDATEIQALQKSMSGITTGQLVTLPIDTLNYHHAEEVKNAIQQIYGHVDLVVAAYNNCWQERSLLELDINEWQKAVDENITKHFITCRIALQMMKEQREGMFVNICNAEVLSSRPYTSLTRILTENQTELSVLFSEEVKRFNVRYYHLFVNDVVSVKPVTDNNYLLTPEMAGEHIIKLFHKQTGNSDQLFQHFPALQAESA